MSWTRSLLPRSLRGRLILSFGALVFLSLFLAGAATAYLLRTEQVRAARERVGRLAEPVAVRAAFLQANGITDPTEIQAVLEGEYGGQGIRILLIDGDTIVADSDATLRGATIAQLNQQGVPARPLDGVRFRWQRLRSAAENLLIFYSPDQGAVATIPGLPGAFVPRYQAVLAVDAGAVSHAWRDLLPRLFLAGGVAFLAGVVAASLLARSISQPLRQITAASEEMARGRYDQQLPSFGGGEEVTRLSQAFDAMARQVSRSHRTLRDFLANVSHELKTPLTSIQGFSQAIVDGAVTRPEDLAEAGRIINDEAQRMRGLVDDLLYLSQVEAGEFIMHLDRISPNELLAATSERFQRRAEQAEVGLVVDATPTPPIKADARRLEQALANIVDNAVRHTPAGGRVTLRSAAENGHVRLAVHNTGSVIAPAALPLIFDRFFQADPTGARADANTGLGLAITKEIVEAHGGAVTATSSAEAGTEFVITLPIGPLPQGEGRGEG